MASLGLYMHLGLGVLLPAFISAHGHVGTIVSDGKSFRGWNFGNLNNVPRPQTVGWVAAQYSDGYIEPTAVANPDIICHKAATLAPLYVDAKPGSKLVFKWDDWPSGNVHPGPILNYIAKCDVDCTTQNKSTLSWVKMDATGVNFESTRGDWATFDMEAAGDSWSLTIPNLEPGNYVIRHEIIALHYAFRTNGAEFYPQCVNFKISGNGTGKLSGGVLGAQLYKATDPGIAIDISKLSATNVYVMPGPPVGTFTNV